MVGEYERDTYRRLAAGFQVGVSTVYRYLREAAPSKNYRYSTNLQVAIDANTRLVIALGDPQPGNRKDTVVYRTSGIDQNLAGRPVIADGGYRGNAGW